MPIRSQWNKVRIPKLILASASPRRREILQNAGIAFDVLHTSIPEKQRRGESPRAFVLRMAAAKAEAARADLGAGGQRPILGADTVVVVEGKTLGKPSSAPDARRMLRLLSGRSHQVLTGLCLLYPTAGRSAKASRKQIVREAGWKEGWKRDARVASTTVKFRRLTRDEIDGYVASGEPFDKAGAYAIQGRASKYVEWIDGCYFNVVGLPISLLYEMLCEMPKLAE